MRRVCAFAITLFVFAVAGGRANADEFDDETAFRRRMDPGIALFRAERYEDALKEFLAAKRIDPKPILELWIGRCYDRLNAHSQAIAHYARYVELVPDSENVPTVRERMRALREAARSSPNREDAPESSYEPVVRRSDIPQKRFGLGSILGGGYYGVTASDGMQTASLGGPAFFIGDLALNLPFSRRAELQIWIPLLMLVLDEVLADISHFWTAFFAKIYLHGDGDGFFLAPGLGFQIASKRNVPTLFVFEWPSKIGYEFATQNRAFSVSIALRAWLDVLNAGSATGVGGGGVLELEFSGYWTRH